MRRSSDSSLGCCRIFSLGGKKLRQDYRSTGSLCDMHRSQYYGTSLWEKKKHYCKSTGKKTEGNTKFCFTQVGSGGRFYRQSNNGRHRKMQSGMISLGHAKGKSQICYKTGHTSLHISIPIPQSRCWDSTCSWLFCSSPAGSQTGHALFTWACSSYVTWNLGVYCIETHHHHFVTFCY